MKIKTFRGKIADGGIDRIYLAGDQPGDGYRIIKMQLFHCEPGENSAEHTVKVYSTPQTSADNAVNFSDDTLLAAGHLADHSDIAYALDTIAVFDQIKVNQDIYVTHEDTRGSEPVNYYIELEQVKLSNGEQAAINFVACLQHGE
jgi:hypothetical protein